MLDDDSTDGRGRAASSRLRDSRFRVLEGSTARPAPGQTDRVRPAVACDARGSVLVFVDADVRLAPHAVAATVDLLRRHRLDLVSPYPRQEAVGPGAPGSASPAVVVGQHAAAALGRTITPSVTVGGQRPAARGRRRHLPAAGGHAAVADQVLDDIALLRAVKAVGGRGGVADGTALASCRMYRTSTDLWTATASRSGLPRVAPAAMGIGAALALTYLLPPAAALLGSRAGLAGYAAGVAGRAVVARRTGGRWSRTQPPTRSRWVLLWLGARSWRGHRRGTLTWKGRSLDGRSLPAAATPARCA